jgi:hypothetical protein
MYRKEEVMSNIPRTTRMAFAPYFPAKNTLKFAAIIADQH